MHDQITTGPPERPTRTADRQPVAVLSAAVLVAARAAYGEDRADLAARAGLAVHVVDGAEDGTDPAWSLAYPEFMALADAVAAPHASRRELFETAAACDLLVTCLLDGDQAMATDVLADNDTPGHDRGAFAVGDNRGPPVRPARRAHAIRARRRAFWSAA
jgi:hypothetical protein